MLRCGHGMHVSTPADSLLMHVSLPADSLLPPSDLLACHTFGYSKIAVKDTEIEDVFLSPVRTKLYQYQPDDSLSNKASYEQPRIKKKGE